MPAIRTVSMGTVVGARGAARSHNGTSVILGTPLIFPIVNRDDDQDDRDDGVQHDTEPQAGSRMAMRARAQSSVVEQNLTYVVQN